MDKLADIAEKDVARETETETVEDEVGKDMVEDDKRDVGVAVEDRRVLEEG